MARDQRGHVRKEEALSAASTDADTAANMPLATTRAAQHPCLIQIVRLLARQTAKADIAAQRGSISEE